MRRFALAVVAATVAAGLPPANATASGGPPIFTSLHGIPTPSGKSMLETVGSGGRTIIARIDRRSNRLEAARSLPLSGFGIPAIGLYRPTPAGLSRDGRTLVLQHISYGRSAASAFAIVDAKSLRVRGEILRLRGAFGYDGLSPDGRRLFLVQYPSPLRDPGHYVVRAYDLTAARLISKPVVDPRDDEQMRGLPVMRATSPSGRWAFTLYTGTAQGKVPFIHALDLGEGKAKCIDLPRSIGGVYNDRLRITPDGRTMTISNRHKGKLASVDTRTFDVSTVPPASKSTAEAGDGFPWLLLVLGAGLIVAAASLWGMPKLNRRRLAGE